MNILYVSCYPRKFIGEILDKAKKMAPLGGQVMNSLYVHGLMENDCKVTVLVPTNPLSYGNKFYSKAFDIVEDGITYHFAPYLKIKKIGTIYTLLHIKKYLNKYLKNNKNNDTVLMYDILLPFKYSIMKLFYKQKKQIIAIVTDLPSFFDSKLKGIKNKISNFKNNQISQFITKYILITEAMNEKINPENKPFLVVEGLSTYKEISPKKEVQVDKNIVMYSGDLSKLYGIMNLIDAFKKIKREDWELHLYGKCNYDDELNEICKKHPNIKYFGMLPNEEILIKQKEATLLINPRPLNLEFSPYSFPSKTIEYMASGTPVLTTKLEGIPSDYYDYLIFLKGDSIQDIYDGIHSTFDLKKEQLQLIGNNAQKFVINKKNYVIRMKEVINFIKKGED